MLLKSGGTSHEQQLEKLKGLTSGTLTLGATARMLHIPAKRVRQLVDLGILTPLISKRSTKSAAWMFPRDAVSRFQLRPAGSVTAKSEVIAIRDVLRFWHLEPEDVRILFAALADGSLITVGVTSVIAPIGVALIRKCDGRIFLDTARIERSGLMSVDQAASKLGIKQQVAYHLVKRGLLNSTNDSHVGARVSTADIEAFQAVYISLAAISAHIGRSPTATMRVLTARPVCGSSVDACRQYFYRRADVAHIALPAQQLFERES